MYTLLSTGLILGFVFLVGVGALSLLKDLIMRFSHRSEAEFVGSEECNQAAACAEPARAASTRIRANSAS